MIADLPPLREVIEATGLRADKRFGQNFLMDLNITRKIVREAGLASKSHVIEVGPGPGGLTRALLENGHSVHAIEMDARIEPILKQLQSVSDGKLTYELNDALKYNWTGVRPCTSIVSNLPYNVATPLIIGWLKQSYIAPESIDRMALMVQSEVADRICAAPHSKTYGRLSVLCANGLWTYVLLLICRRKPLHRHLKFIRPLYYLPRNVHVRRWTLSV